MKIPRPKMPGAKRSRVQRIGGVAAVALLAVVAGVTVVTASNTYTVQFVMPSAAGTFEGDAIQINGQSAGTVDKIEVRNGKALVTVSLHEQFTPLHDGTTARISWGAVLSERSLEVLPGPKNRPKIHSGDRIVSNIERVTLGEVLAMLDPKTITDANSLIQQVKQVLHGREKALRNTLHTAGPALNAAGQVLQAVGSDGPAIRKLVTQLHQVTSTLAQKDGKLASTVNNLGKLTSRVAQQQGKLSKGLAELPSTLQAANKTLDKVPEAVNQTVPLLNDLRPATSQLPSVAANLDAVVTELRPTVRELRPTLNSAHELLQRTPGLLDSAHGVLPDLTDIVQRVQPAVTFLRPYTPELAGWVSNWTQIFSAEDATGNYARALLTASASSVGDNPGIIPPGQKRDERPAPGSIAGQAWTDANGDSPR